MKVLVVAKGDGERDSFVSSHNKRGLIQQLSEAGIKTDILTLSDAKTRIASKSVAVTPLRHFTSTINESWAAGTMLACKAADIYHKEGFDVVQANDLASVIAGVQLKWSFNVGLTYAANERELANTRVADMEIRKGIEEIMRFCIPYVDHVIIVQDSGSLEMLKTYGIDSRKIETTSVPSKIVEIYCRLEST